MAVPKRTSLVTLGVTDVERSAAFYEDWLAAGGTVHRHPYAADWGGYIAYVADPDGHVWELAHNPYWPFDADGRVVLPE
jgi:uncharacterized glyoxalase superfamily protein PhnB